MNYLILDSSSSDENHRHVRPYLSNRVRYFRFDPESSTRDYVNKVICGLDSVSTEAILLVDNDDILLRRGLERATHHLNDCPSIGAGGPIIGFTMRGPNSRFSSAPLLYSSCSHISAATRHKEVNRYRQQHANLWNLVYRTTAMKSAWRATREFDPVELHQLEFFLCERLLTQGSICQTSLPHYARLENQSDRLVMSVQLDPKDQVGGESWLALAASFDSRISLTGNGFLGSTNEQAMRIELIGGRASYSMIDKVALRIRRWISMVNWMPKEAIMRSV